VYYWVKPGNRVDIRGSPEQQGQQQYPSNLTWVRLSPVGQTLQWSSPMVSFLARTKPIIEPALQVVGRFVFGLRYRHGHQCGLRSLRPAPEICDCYPAILRSDDLFGTHARFAVPLARHNRVGTHGKIQPPQTIADGRLQFSDIPDHAIIDPRGR
jgi:hypothetical protein